jgi:hypothetical protein
MSHQAAGDHQLRIRLIAVFHAVLHEYAFRTPVLIFRGYIMSYADRPSHRVTNTKKRLEHAPGLTRPIDRVSSPILCYNLEEVHLP